MEIPLRDITHAVSGGLAHGLKTVIYALDDNGMMWSYESKTGWQRVENPRTGAGKAQPDDTGDHTPSWNNL